MKEKKKLSILLVLVLLIYPLVTATKVQAASEAINIKDEVLKKVILKELDKSDDYSITKSDMESMTKLSYDSHSYDLGKISDLSGLEYCTNLEELSLINNNLEDISPLKNLSKLTTLDLSSNNISDISPLKDLKNLDKLNAKYNSIMDLSPLKNFIEKGDNIDVSGQSVRLTIEEISNSFTMKNPVIDADNTILPPRYISSDGIYDEKTNTTTWNSIKGSYFGAQLIYGDVHMLSLLPSSFTIMQSTKVPIFKSYTLDLYIRYEPKNIDGEGVNIRDKVLRSAILKALDKPNDYSITKEDMNSIESLSYSGNESEKITDLSGLELCSNLKKLSLPYNEISNLSPLSKLTNLSELALDHNEILNLEPLKKLTNLKVLTLSHNCISQIRPLLKLADNLVYINLENQKINFSIDEFDEFEEFNKSNCYDLLDTDYLFDNDLIDETPELTRLSTSDPGAKSYIFKYPLNCFHIADPCVMSTNEFSGSITVTCGNIPIDIPDENLRDCILDALNKNSRYTITKKDLESLTSLNCNNCDINDISGLEYCTNLKELDLTSNNISDLSPLSSLKDKIENLFITHQKIELKEKSSQGKLTIKNPITGYDNKPLKPRKISNDGIYNEENNTITWSNLTEDISKLTIKYSDGEAAHYDDINSTSPVPLPGIPTGYSCTVTLPVNVINPDTLPVLIEDNKLKAALLDTLGKDSDYTIVRKDMETITSLDLSNKGIKNIKGLEFCKNLKTINLNNNKLTDISPLSKLKNLEKAELEDNRITDISCLYNNTTSKLPYFNITNQYIVLNFVSCDGNYSMENIIKDMPTASITEISNGGKYIKPLNIISWNNLKKNTTVSYSYSKTLSEKEAKELNAPLINYSCKVNRYIKVTSAE